MSVVLDADRIARSLARIAHEILERNRGIEEVALVGIRTRGVPLARRIAKSIHDVSSHDVPCGALDITLYRDDRELPIKADYVGKNIPTSSAQNVQVHLTEVDGRDEVEVLP